MSLLDALSSIKKALSRDPAQLARDLDQPTPLETGMRHPTGNGYLVMRDDSIAEIGAGPAATLTLDGAQGQAHLKGVGVAIEAQYLHLHAPPGQLYIGYQPFSPFWQSGPLDPVSPFWRTAPLVQNFPAALEGLFVVTNPAPLLTGTPAPGQLPVPPVPLLTYLHAEPLLGVNEELLLLGRNLASLMRLLAGF